MLRTIFTFNLREKILEGRVAIGTFDGSNPCMVAATNGDKVLIHNPHETPSSSSSQSAFQSNLTVSSSNKTFLNINQTIKSLAVGCFDWSLGKRRDVLFVGTPTSILAYDVQKNSGIFLLYITRHCKEWWSSISWSYSELPLHKRKLQSNNLLNIPFP